MTLSDADVLQHARAVRVKILEDLGLHDEVEALPPLEQEPANGELKPWKLVAATGEAEESAETAAHRWWPFVRERGLRERVSSRGASELQIVVIATAHEGSFSDPLLFRLADGPEVETLIVSETAFSDLKNAAEAEALSPRKGS